MRASLVDNRPVEGHAAGSAGGACLFDLHTPELRQPDTAVTMMSAGGVTVSDQYSRNVALFLGEDLVMYLSWR